VKGIGVFAMTVQIGVVDTGVDKNHQLFRRRAPTGIGVVRRGGCYEYQPDFHDHHGHGTAMAARIATLCRKARIHAVRIAQQDESGLVVRVQERALAMGIEWCVAQNVHIVNVSYSIAAASEDGFLARACKAAHEKRVIVVAAYRNGENAPVYPAAFPTVIGVRCRDDLTVDQVSVLARENFDLYAPGCSNSIACAQVSAMIGRICSFRNRHRLEEVFGTLMDAGRQAGPLPRSEAIES
jgi:subtilisin